MSLSISGLGTALPKFSVTQEQSLAFSLPLCCSDENQAELMRSARIVPEQENGKVVGIRLFGIRPETLLGTLGLENGDRLQTINGFDMASPEKALEAMRRALAMGADRVVLVSDEAVAGSDLVATSRVLAAALERESADLVLFGQQANDGDGAVLWAAVADRLQQPLISQVAELSHEDGKVRGKRQTEFGYDVIEAPVPAVVAVSITS